MPTHFVKPVEMSEETLRFKAANDELKFELLRLIDQMDTQLMRAQRERAKRIQERRQ